MTDDVGFGAPSAFGGVIPTPASWANRPEEKGTLALQVKPQSVIVWVAR
jgi:hypothetical protein